MTRFDVYCVLLIVVALVAGGYFISGKNKGQCDKIVVTGIPGQMSMAVDGRDLYLTGVAEIRCGEYVPAEPHQLGF